MPVRREFTVRASLEQEAERADALIAAQRKRAWTTIGWREGSNGRLRGRFVALRCWRQTDMLRWVEGWLIGAVPPRGQTGGSALVLEQRPARDTVGQAGGVRPSPASGRALPAGRQDVVGMGPVSRTTLGRLPPPRRPGDAGLLLSGLDRMAAGRAPGQAGATRCFPLGRIAVASRWRRFIGACSTGCACLPLTNASARGVSTTTAPTRK